MKEGRDIDFELVGVSTGDAIRVYQFGAQCSGLGWQERSEALVSDILGLRR